jgi:hypothetical protein
VRKEIFISYSRKDETWLKRLQDNLTPLTDKYPLNIWDDTKIKPGERWQAKIEDALDAARIAILLVSPNFLASDFIKRHELPPLLAAAKESGLKILWIAVSASVYEETEIGQYQSLNNPDKPLDGLSPADRNRELVKITRKILAAAVDQTDAPPEDTKSGLREAAKVSGYQSPSATNNGKVDPVPIEQWETEGGAVPIGSRFYINRPVDEEMFNAIKRLDGIIRIKGVKQVGKTSLVQRGLEVARQSKSKVVLTDFEGFNATTFDSLESLYLQIATLMATKLKIDPLPEQTWNKKFPPNSNFENYVRDVVLQKAGSLVWALDEVDRLFEHEYKDEFFGLLRSWFNERANSNAPWRQCTIIIAYATEPQLYIKNLHVSPFNVGHRVPLEDFDKEHLKVLNRKYGLPLSEPEEIDSYSKLVGGHPYLIRRGLHHLAKRKVRENGNFKLEMFEEQAVTKEEPFGDHLRRILFLVNKHEDLKDAVVGLLGNRPLPSPEIFYRLQSAGIVLGDSAHTATMRCMLYTKYLTRQLL